jgi:hypothetical protein
MGSRLLWAIGRRNGTATVHRVDGVRIKPCQGFASGVADDRHEGVAQRLPAGLAFAIVGPAAGRGATAP